MPHASEDEEAHPPGPELRRSEGSREGPGRGLEGEVSVKHRRLRAFERRPRKSATSVSIRWCSVSTDKGEVSIEHRRPWAWSVD